MTRHAPGTRAYWHRHTPEGPVRHEAVVLAVADAAGPGGPILHYIRFAAEMAGPDGHMHPVRGHRTVLGHELTPIAD